MFRDKTGKTCIGVMACTMLAASGCTQASDGMASPSASTAAQSTVSGTTAAPTVTHPLDVSKFMSDPCLSLTQVQVADLNIGPQGKRANANVNVGQFEGCAWPYGANQEYDVTVGYSVPEDKNGLQNLYNLKAAGWYDRGYFVQTTIGDYPAVFNSAVEDRAKGRCQLSVGINEQAMIFILIRGPEKTDLCKGASKAAADAVETVKRG